MSGTENRYRLTLTAFHGGRICPVGDIITLGPGEKPGAHMVPHVDEAPVLRIVEPMRVQPRKPSPATLAPSPVMQMGPVALPPAAHKGFVVLDTETNGFEDPRLAGIALIFVSVSMMIEHEVAFLVRPNGWQMSKEATSVNGLTDERLAAEGIDAAAALHLWKTAISLGRTPVGHNLGFDLRVMANEFAHAREDAPDPGEGLCTLEPLRRLCGVGALSKAYKEMTGEDMTGAHDAIADARATLTLFAKLREKGELQ